MNHTMKRRDFIKTTAQAATLALTAPSLNLHAAEAGSIGLAFVGCAHIHTPGFINLLKTRPEVKVKYTWDHDAARAAQRAGELGAKAVTDLEVIWSDPEIAGVVICSETNRHLALVQAAAKARKHMFVEKPLGITARDSLAMAEAIDKAGVLFTTGYFMRTDPKHLFLKAQVEAGNFGKITRVRGSNCHSGSLGGWFDTEWRWMADPKQAGVGGFGDLGTHSLDILLWIFGKIEEATADIKVVTRRYDDCDECGEGLMQFANGIIGTLAAGWVDVADPVTFLVSGTEGHAAIINGQLFYRSAKVEGADGRNPWTKLPSAPPLPLNQFVNAIAGNKDMPLVKPQEAAYRVCVMEAMYEAARGRKWVKPL
jgi:predicted dehydrogenase